VAPAAAARPVRWDRSSSQNSSCESALPLAGSRLSDERPWADLVSVRRFDDEHSETLSARDGIFRNFGAVVRHRDDQTERSPATSLTSQTPIHMAPNAGMTAIG
jgi:hypothetical protein